MFAHARPCLAFPQHVRNPQLTATHDMTDVITKTQEPCRSSAAAARAPSQPPLAMPPVLLHRRHQAPRHHVGFRRPLQLLQQRQAQSRRCPPCISILLLLPKASPKSTRPPVSCVLLRRAQAARSRQRHGHGIRRQNQKTSALGLLALLLLSRHHVNAPSQGAAAAALSLSKGGQMPTSKPQRGVRNAARGKISLDVLLASASGT